ncbi:hypothetical protein AAMO2058_001628700, partial [Amorphochlora amoebiformis]
MSSIPHSRFRLFTHSCDFPSTPPQTTAFSRLSPPLSTHATPPSPPFLPDPGRQTREPTHPSPPPNLSPSHNPVYALPYAQPVTGPPPFTPTGPSEAGDVGGFERGGGACLRFLDEVSGIHERNAGTAFAVLVDGALDRSAGRIEIGPSGSCLSIVDDGIGLDKDIEVFKSHFTVGSVHGPGFHIQAAMMRIGRDALVVTKSRDRRHATIGLLSRTLHQSTKPLWISDCQPVVQLQEDLENKSWKLFPSDSDSKNKS